MTAPEHEIDLSGTAHGQLAVARRILTADELVKMTEVRPRFEKEIQLPGDSRARNAVFLFSIDGYLEGEPLKGVLFAGECMLVQARSLKMAERVAKEGLRDTVRYIREEYEDRITLETPAANDVINAGLAVEGQGKHGAVGPADDPRLLASDPLMKSILAAEIGKIKWRH